MEPLASSSELSAYVGSPKARESPSEADEGTRLGALLVVLTPFALAAWFAIGLAVYRGVT